MGLRKLSTFILVFALLMPLFVMSPQAVSAASNNCSKIGSVKVVGQQSFRCMKGSGGLKVWVKVGMSGMPNSKNASCAKGGKCQVGDIGPGGGTVFYASKTVFSSIGSDCDPNCRYLEASPTDMNGRFTWDDANAAANSCKGCRLAGWRLPTKDELEILYKVRFTIAGFLRKDLTPYCPGMWKYWSSTIGEDYSSAYYYVSFDGQRGYPYPKSIPMCVRPVRSFG